MEAPAQVAMQQRQGPQGGPPQAQQQIDIKELFAMIGELNVQLMATNKVVLELRAENAQLKAQAKAGEDKKDGAK